MLAPTKLLLSSIHCWDGGKKHSHPASFHPCFDVCPSSWTSVHACMVTYGQSCTRDSRKSLVGANSAGPVGVSCRQTLPHEAFRSTEAGYTRLRWSRWLSIEGLVQRHDEGNISVKDSSLRVGRASLWLSLEWRWCFHLLLRMCQRCSQTQHFWAKSNENQGGKDG